MGGILVIAAGLVMVLGLAWLLLVVRLAVGLTLILVGGLIGLLIAGNVTGAGAVAAGLGLAVSCCSLGMAKAAKACCPECATGQHTAHQSAAQSGTPPLLLVSFLCSVPGPPPDCASLMTASAVACVALLLLR